MDIFVNSVFTRVGASTSNPVSPNFVDQANAAMGLVSTWMGDRLRASKPSLYVTSHLGQLSLPSLGGR